MSSLVSQKVLAYFSKFPEKTYENGTIITRPGKPFPGILLLTSGRVIQYDISDTGQSIIVNTFLPQAFFPLAQAVNHQENFYYYETVGNTSGYLAPTEKVLMFLQKEPDVLFDVLSRVYIGTEGLQRKLAHALGGSAMTRLTYELSIQCKRSKSTAERIELQTTHEQLAQLTGLSRETVNRCMKKLKASGVIETKYGSIVVNKPRELDLLLGSRL